MNNLNRVTEENIKTIFKQSEILDRIRSANDSMAERCDKNDKAIIKLQNEILRFNDIEKSLRNNTEKIEDSEKEFTQFTYNTNKKLSDFETNLNKVIDNINDNYNNHYKKSMDKNDNNINTPQINIDPNSNNQMLTDLTKNNKDIEKLKKQLRENVEKLDKNYTKNISFEEKIKKLEDIVLDDSEDYSDNDNDNDNENENENENYNENDNEVNNDNDNNNNKKKSKNKKGKNKFNNNSNNNSAGGAGVNFNNNNDIDNESINQSIEMLFDKLKKIQDGLKIINNNINLKADKADIEKLNLSLSQEVEKISNKFKEFNKTTEVKIKNIINNQFNNNIGNNNNSKDGNNKNLNNPNLNFNERNSPEKNVNEKFGDLNLINQKGVNGFELDEAFIYMSKEILNQELTNNKEIIKINDFIDNYKPKVDLNKTEIDKIFESLVEIRRAVFDNKNLEEELNSFHDKLNDLADRINQQKNLIENKLKNSYDESLENTEENADTKNLSIKDIVKNLNFLCKNLSEKLEKLSTRQDNMNGEILTKVKKDLTNESNKILSEFRENLGESISRIENKLKEKVDKLSLEELGKKVDNKMTNEMNKKIDKTELRKNNNIINKKIDGLENKLSKTFVDTLIDLQMEEAPLLVKKSIYFGSNNNSNNDKEKCASCNQFILNSTIILEEPNNNNCTNNFHSCNTNRETNNNLNNTSQIKFKFRNAQENCYKFGAGSYSRYLNGIDNAEDLKNKTFQLPDISSSGKHSRRFNSNALYETKFKNRFVEEGSEKNMNLDLMINEELEKKRINPENLLKTANKIYENIEKERKIIDRNNNFK